MAAKEVLKGKIICSEGHSLDALHILASGSVKAHFAGGDIILKKGDVVGLCDIAFDSHFFTCTTLENSSFISFPYSNSNSIGNTVRVNPEVGKMMYVSMVNQLNQVLSLYSVSKEKCASLYEKVNKLYEDYLDICERCNVISRSLPGLDAIEPFETDEELPDYLIPYYSCIKDFPQDLKHSLSSRIPFLAGFLIRASEDIHSAFSACSEMSDYLTDIGDLIIQDSRLDLFDLYTSLALKLPPDTPDADAVNKTIESLVELANSNLGIDSELANLRINEYRTKLSSITVTASATTPGSEKVFSPNLTNALDIILDYSGVEESFANNFKNLLSKYKKLPDKASSEEGARKLRMELTKSFYTIYQSAFQMSVKDLSIPTVVMMFFNFGFMDAELAGIENSNYLYKLAETFRGNAEMGVYTAHEWLTSIYRMQKDPSRNEFDVDYLEYIRELRVTGKIDAEQEKRLAKDPGERVLFELNNMFPLVNKVTFGRLSSFCPILCESDVVKPLQSCLVTIDAIYTSIAKIEAVDYSAFFRDTIYTNDSCGISKEYVATRILPDVILFPNVGTRGVMWQEIEGRKRTTPARFAVSVFHMEDIATTLTRLVGEYRWEMCKRIQGARWNDVSERSLTSEYFDYVQFYRKNNDLSAEAKEKVKASLVKAKNSFKEMFVRDYITWVLFEGTGSPRLNKVARAIMITYCPFPYSLRQKIQANPIFKDLIEKYNIKTAAKLHHMDNVITKLRSSGQDVPPELVNQRLFLEGIIEK